MLDRRANADSPRITDLVERLACAVCSAVGCRCKGIDNRGAGAGAIPLGIELPRRTIRERQIAIAQALCGHDSGDVE